MVNQVMIDMDLRHLELDRAFQQRGVSSSFESSQRAELKLADSRSYITEKVHWSIMSIGSW